MFRRVTRYNQYTITYANKRLYIQQRLGLEIINLNTVQQKQQLFQALYINIYRPTLYIYYSTTHRIDADIHITSYVANSRVHLFVKILQTVHFPSQIRESGKTGV